MERNYFSNTHEVNERKRIQNIFSLFLTKGGNWFRNFKVPTSAKYFLGKKIHYTFFSKPKKLLIDDASIDSTEVQNKSRANKKKCHCCLECTADYSRPDKTYYIWQAVRYCTANDSS